jgi:hypothetical protein
MLISRFLRQPSRPNAPRPLINNGSVARHDSAVAAYASDCPVARGRAGSTKTNPRPFVSQGKAIGPDQNQSRATTPANAMIKAVPAKSWIVNLRRRASLSIRSG